MRKTVERSRVREGSPMVTRDLWWEGFVEKVSFEVGVKTVGVMDGERVATR